MKLVLWCTQRFGAANRALKIVVCSLGTPLLSEPQHMCRSWDVAASSQPTPSYPQQSLNVISALLLRYSSKPALLGFGVLNEPTVRVQAADARSGSCITQAQRHSFWVAACPWSCKGHRACP